MTIYYTKYIILTIIHKHTAYSNLEPGLKRSVFPNILLELDFHNEKDFQQFGENSGPSSGFSFISSLVSHCVSNSFETDARTSEIANLGEMIDESTLTGDAKLDN